MIARRGQSSRMQKLPESLPSGLPSACSHWGRDNARHSKLQAAHTMPKMVKWGTFPHVRPLIGLCKRRAASHRSACVIGASKVSTCFRQGRFTGLLRSYHRSTHVIRCDSRGTFSVDSGMASGCLSSLPSLSGNFQHDVAPCAVRTSLSFGLCYTAPQARNFHFHGQRSNKMATGVNGVPEFSQDRNKPRVFSNG